MKNLFILLLAFIASGALQSRAADKTLLNGSVQADSEPRTAVVRKCHDFRITGNGGSAEWNSAEWISLLPQGVVYSDYTTKVKILYSEKGIYFLFNCSDKKLTSTMRADNLNLWEEDVVEVFLWTSEDFPVYFEYEISPMDYELPIIVPNYKGKFLGWLPWNYSDDKRTVHATSAVGGEKKGGAVVSAWIAEFFIPYKLLNPLPQVPPVPGTRWRANMYRIDYDNGASHFAWQKTNRTFHEYNSFGTLVFE